MSDDGPWLTRTEIARRMGKNESTIRLWCDRFEDALPLRRDDDGHLRGPLWAFQEIARMRSEHRSDHEIRERLTGGQPPPSSAWQDEIRAARDEVLGELREIHRLLEEVLRERRAPPG